MADSISKAQLTLQRYNNSSKDDNTLSIPEYVVLIRKDDAVSFFRDKKLPDNQTSFIASFSKTFNSYTFENLGRFLTYCRYEREKGVQESGLSPEAWEAAHPNWNKMVAIPVSVVKTTDAYGSTAYASVSHNMALSSTRLVGGPNTPIKMQVLYSRFK